MSSAFAALRPSRIRVTGVAVALILLVLLAVLTLVVASGGPISLPPIRIGLAGSGSGGASAYRAFAIATLLVACVFSWLLAEVAVRPGWRAVVAAALAFASGAVVLGSFLVAGLASFAAGGGIATVIGSTVALGLLGVLIIGVPMLIISATLAVIWVGLVRAVVRMAA